MVSPVKIALIAGLVLIAVGSYAAYTSYTESKLMTFGAGQTKAWIFGDGPISIYSLTPVGLPVTEEEIARYTTLKAYFDYMDTMPGITPLKSVSVDLREARSIVSFLSLRANIDVKPQTYGVKGEWYVFFIEENGRFYSINILFNDERPVLD